MSVGAIETGSSYQISRSETPSTRSWSATSEELAVGQLVEVTVVDRSGVGRYDVSINGQHHFADSTTALQPGSTVLAVVTALGDRLELRAVSPGEDPALAQALAALAAKYRVDLAPTSQREVVAAAEKSSNPIAILRAGLFLQKIGEQITPAALAAVVATQRVVTPTELSAHERADAELTVGTGSHLDSKDLAELFEQVMMPAGDARAGAGPGTGFGDAGPEYRRPRDGAKDSDANAGAGRTSLGQELLNLSDGSARDYRFATLPLLVGGMLFELDMALFQQRSTTAMPGSPRRLVMAMSTSQLGVVRVVAQTFNSHLSVSLSSNSERGVTLLSALVKPITHQLTSLGMQVDSVRVEQTPDSPSPGAEIVEQVLRTGSLDRAV
jgi:hypothetical protein